MIHFIIGIVNLFMIHESIHLEKFTKFGELLIEESGFRMKNLLKESWIVSGLMECEVDKDRIKIM